MAEQRAFTPNQIVAYNLNRARTLRGWTLDQTAERLAPYVGETWTRANLSALERSQAGNRPRRFETHDIVIYGLVFDLSPLWFLIPPPHASRIALQDSKGKTVESLEPSEYLDRLLFRGWTEIHYRLDELPPEHQGDVRERQRGLLEHYTAAALQDRTEVESTLRELAERASDLADRFSDAKYQALERIRDGHTDTSAGPTYQEVMKKEEK